MNKLLYSNIIRSNNNYLRTLSNRLSLAPSSSSCNGKVVVVTSGKGGVGKTTTAASFAYGLAELGYFNLFTIITIFKTLILIIHNRT